MAFTFDPVFAVDPNNPANIAKNASITIFDPADPSQAPIAIVDPTGSPLPNPITVDAAGMGPAYQHPTLARVGWKGAGFVGYFTSYEGMLNETIAAKDAAQVAAAHAAESAVTEVHARITAGEFTGAPGKDGKDGANVLPTQEAITQAFTTDGPAKTALNATIGKPVRTQVAGKLVANAEDDGGRSACWMDASRTRMFMSNRNVLRYSDDDAVTFVDVPGFKTTHIVDAVRDMENGEILVFTSPSSRPTGRGAVWVSSGFNDPQTATFRKVQTAAADGVYFTGSWGIHVYKNIVLVNEYGPKPGGTGNAKNTYMSRDYGLTWTRIFDLGTGTGNHLHGVCYDPYWDRIWITYGDDTSAIMFSDTMGESWIAAQSTTVAAGPYQAVGIVALPNCVLFASDGHPNGILRIPRAAGKKTTTYVNDIEVALQIDDATSLKWLFHQPFKAQRPGDDAPVLFPVAPELNTGKSKVYATKDGYEFNLIWEDTIDTTNRGAQVALGPTARGRLLIVTNDGRTANYSKWRGNMPAGY